MLLLSVGVAYFAGVRGGDGNGTGQAVGNGFK